MKKLVILFCLVTITRATAQETTEPVTPAKERYFLLGMGLANQSFYDKAVSKVRYGGSGIAPILGHVKTRPGRFSQFLFQASFINLNTKRSDALRPMKVSTIGLLTDYQQLYSLPSLSSLANVQLGGLVSLLAVYKEAPQLDNSAIVYDYALTLGVSARAYRSIRLLRHDCRLSWQLSLPLLAHIARPLYLNQIEFLDTENDFLGDVFSNARIVTLNRYLRLNSQLLLDYHLKTGNSIRLGYHWDFYRMKTLNRVFAAEHLFSLALMFRY